MRRPLIIPAAGIAAGIILAYFMYMDDRALLLAGTIALFFSLLRLKDRQKPHLYALIFFVVAGALLANSKVNEFELLQEEKNIELIGVVTDISISDGADRITIKAEYINGKPSSTSILVNYDRKTIIAELGDSVIFKGNLSLPSQNSNPGFFNYKRYLQSKGIGYTASGDRSELRVLESNNSIFYSLRSGFINFVAMRFDKGLRPENASFMKGLILGDSRLLDKDEYELYKDMGLAHLLAVSGLHIGLIAGGLTFILSRLGLKRRHNFLIALIIVVMYGFAIGMPASAARGILMFFMIYFSHLLHRPSDQFNILCGSFIILLLIEPLWIFNSGFQLSFAATGSLILFSDRIRTAVYPLKGKIVDSLSAVISVNLGMLPVQAYWFNVIPVIALISNLIVVPVASMTLITGFIALIIPVTMPVLEFLLELQRIVAHITSAIPMKPLIIKTFSLTEVTVYFFAIAVFLNRRYLQSLEINLKKTIVVWLLFASVSTLLISNNNNSVKIDFIDVGQGDSALIMTSKACYLIDAGGSLNKEYDVGERITLPYLEKQGVKKIDAAFVSHRHEDHYLGLLPVISQIPTDVIFINAEPPEDLLLIAKEKGIPFALLSGEREITLDDGVLLRILWPEKGHIPYLNENNNSMVMILEAKGTRILFTGDIEKETEAILASKYSTDIDVLKVAHHGSRTSTSEEWLKKFSPEYSIISVGRNNPYGHPTGEVIKRLEEFGIDIFRTDKMGMIRVIIKEDGLEIIPFIKDDWRISLSSFYREYTGFILAVLMLLVAEIALISEYIKGEYIKNGIIVVRSSI